MIVVVPIFLGTEPVTVTGRVLECPGGECMTLGPDTPELELGRLLPGAFVTLSNPGSGSEPIQRTALEGRIQPGMVYTTSGPDGRYALVATALAGGYVLQAVHPRHAGPIAEPVFALAEFETVGAIERNLIFDAPYPGSVTGPVRVNAAHEPVHPGPGLPATLQVNASHGSGAPIVTIMLDRVEPLVEGTQVSTADVQMGAKQEAQLSPTRKRVTLPITATAGKALLATFRIRGAVGAVPPLEIRHSIAFGVGPAPPQGSVVAADDDDAVGPVVVSTIPAEGALAVSPGDTLTLFFNEAIDAAVASQPGALALAGNGGGAPSFQVEVADDQRSLRVRPGPLALGQDYTLTVTSAVKDVSGNDFDQEPGTPGLQSFTLHFSTPEPVVHALPDIESGGGVVLGRGAHAFALERDASPEVVVFDVSSPDDPQVTARIPLPGTPRDLAFIPRYRSVIRPTEAARERDILAVVGGDLGSQSVDADGSIFFPPQYLRLFDVTNPASPVRISHTTLSLRPATISKVEWRPPYLAYLELGADLQAVGQILLQELMIGANLTQEEIDALPLFGVRGIDGNGDGDFTDASEGDRLPEPNPSAEFFGKIGACSIDDTTQRILDFDFEPGYCGLTLSEGKLRNLGGGLGADVPPAYRTVEFEGQPIDRAQGTVSFGAGARPKRMVALFGQPIEIGGGVESRNLVLVSLSPDADGKPRLAVIDVSLPASPALLAMIPFPDDLGLGLLQSVSRRSDGLLALATSTSVLLLDPRLLLAPVPTDPAVSHPSVVGIVPEAGSGAQSLDGNAAGIQVVSLGARNQVVQTAPRLRFVAFTGDLPLVDPDALVDVPDDIQTELGRMRDVASLAPARLRDDAGATKTLDPPSRTVHYHVLADMPGGAGPEVSLALESLSRAGRPLSNLGRNFAPVRAADAQTLADLEQEPRRDCDAPIERFRAKRLSSDPTSPYYNLYLSPPFALVYERIGEPELQALRQSAKREILASGHFVRAALDPAESGNAALRAFVSKVDTNEKVLRPGAFVTARALASPAVVGPNPPPPVGPVAAPGTFGLVNAGNGEMRVEAADMVLPSPRMPIVFERTLGGQDLREGPFGRGWDFSYAERIVPLDADVFPDGQRMPLVERASESLSTRAHTRDVLLETGRSSTVLFRYAGTSPPPEIAADPLLQEKGWLDAAGYYLPQNGVFDVLLRFDDGQFLRVAPDGTQHWYAAGGRLERIYHRWTGNRHVLTYDDRGELVRIDDESVAEDRFLRIGYYRFANDPIFDADVDLATANAFVAGKIARLVDSAGREVEFQYNQDGLLVKRLGVATNGANGGFSGRPTLEYLSADTCSGDLTGVRSGNGAAGAALFVASLDGVDAQPTVSSGSGVAGAIAFTAPGANEASASAGSMSSVSGPAGATQFIFDASGLPERIDAGGQTYETDFDEHGLLEHVRYPAGNEVFYSYDAGNPSLRSRANLISVERRPDARGGDPITRSWSYDERYNQLSGPAQDENGHTITYDAGSDGLEIESIQYPGAGVTLFHYEPNGQLDDSTSALGIAYDVDYATSTGFKSSETVGNLTTSFGYDGSIAARLGHPTTISPPGRTAIQIAYDERGLQQSVVQGARTSRFGYDENGNPTRIEHETGGGPLVETRTYEPNGFLRSIAVAVPAADGGATLTTFEPDAAFRIHKITYPGGAEKTFRYDAQGHLEGYTLGAVDVAYVLDPNGNPTETQVGGDVVRTFVWDGHDRMAQMVEKAEGNDATYDYTYFGSGALASARASDASGVVHSFAVDGLDALGRPTGVLYDGTTADAAVAYAYGPDSVTTSGPVDSATQEYDTAGSITEFRDSGRTITYGRDAAGATQSVAISEGSLTNTIDLGYDPLGDLTSIADSEGALFSYTRRADGAATEVVDAAGGATQQTFTLLGELQTRSLPQGLTGIELRYGAARKPAAMLDPSGLGTTYTYSVDHPYQVQTVTRRDGVVTSVSARDARGNPTSMTIPGGTLAQSFDLQGRLLSQDYVAGDVPFTRTLSWDAIDRVRSASYGSGAASGSVQYTYDALGPLLRADFQHPGGTFAVASTIRADGARTALTYPSGVTVNEARGDDSRLTGVTAGGPLLSVSSFAGSELPENAQLGSAIQETRHYDARGRLLALRYQAGSQPLADFRYLYDALDDPTVRQDVHRGGRADFFAYDAIGRLVRADLGARPDSGSETPRSLPGFAPVLAGFLPGPYARSYQYAAAGLDHLVAAPAENPDALVLPPFAQSFTGHDALLHATAVDGFARGATDALGNVRRTQLAVRARCPVATPCGDAPRLVPATLYYDGGSHLVKVERDDGVSVEYDYQHDGLFHTRRVRAGGTLVSTRTYVWDGPRLLEEYEGGALAGRYFYRDGDAPFAADLRIGGALERFFLLRDASLSVHAVADAAGAVRERIAYDPYGQPVLEARDTAAPEVVAIVATADGVRVQFSEPILPPFDTTAGVAPVAAATSVAGAATLRSGATPVAAQVTLEEGAAGFPFGTVLRVQFPHQPGATLTLDLAAGALRDEWGNALAARSLLFTDAATPGAVLLALTPPATAPERLAASALGQPFLFHGQWFDYEAGLLFLRARHYDPVTGQFLQRDPDGMVASVNAYAGFANDPVGMRDPLGRNPSKQFKSIRILESGVFDGIKHMPGEASRLSKIANADTVLKQAKRRAGNAAQGIADVTESTRIIDRDTARIPTDLDPGAVTESASVRVPQADPTLVDQSVRSGAPVALPDDVTVIRGAPVAPRSPAARVDAAVSPPGGAGGAPAGGRPPGPAGGAKASGPAQVVKHPDPHVVEELLWRGDTRSPDEVIAAGGYHPRGNGQDVAIHVMGGKTARAFPQDMVSTTTDPLHAAGMAGETGYVAIVNGRGRALDVEPFMRSAGLRGGEEEFVIVGGIPLEDVVGWRPVVPNGNGGMALGRRFIRNPSYVP